MTLPKTKTYWRTVASPVNGQVHGLPGLRGRLVATDGVMCWLRTSGNQILEVHLEFFIPDRDRTNLVNCGREVPETVVKPKRKSALDLINSLLLD